MKGKVESGPRSRKLMEEKAKAVIEYYTTTGNYCKLSTVRYFAAEHSLCKKTAYRILKRYEERGTANYAKMSGRKSRIDNNENMQRLENLLEADSNITITEAAEVLQLKRSTVGRMKQKLLKKKPEVQSSAVGSVETVECSNEQCNLVGDDGNVWEPDFEGNDCDFDKEMKSSSSVNAPNFSMDPEVLRNITQAKTKEREGPKGPVRFCIACLTKFKKVPESESRQGQLEANLNAVFILRKVFNLSSESIASFLGKCKGGEISKSVEICSECQTIVDEVLEIHTQIQKLEERMEQCRRVIEEVVRKNRVGHNKRKRQIPRGALIICQMLREQAGSDTVPRIPVNPFLEGDRVAREKYLAQNPPPPCSKAIIKEEIEEAVDPPEEIFGDPFDMENEAEECNQPPNSSFRVIKLNPVYIEVPPNPNSSLNFSTPVLDSSVDFAATMETSVTSGLTSPAPVTSSEVPKLDDTCDICGIGMRPFALPLHKLREHGITMEGYTAKLCTEVGCNYVTLYNEDFRTHAMSHRTNRPRPHTCQFCGKAFTTRQHLRIHEEIHKNAVTRPYQCKICGSSFAVKTYLYLHKRLSHLKRPFPSTKRRRLNT